EMERKRLEEQAENMRNRAAALRSVARGQTATDNADEQDPDTTAQSSQRFSGPPMPFRPGPISRPGFIPFPGAVSQSNEPDSQQPDSVNQDNVNQEQNTTASGSPPTNAQPPSVQPNPVQPNPVQPRPAMPNFNNSVGMSRAGKGFSETTPNDYVLVGFSVTLKKWGNNSNDSIESVQPLYRVLNGTATKRGAVCGNATGASKTVYAPAGYAVGAINGRAVAIVDGLELICMKIKPDGTLDPNDTKTLPWVGNTEAGSPKLVDGKGQPVLEVKGYTDEFLSSLEFVF
ncbi:MAG: hypothetical protein FWD31_14520, partial [Planctomycetaceae bacterium]|nr:hypothetical protein [Planctomycetaceae bacterium]